MTHLLQFSIGPVQSFISDARKAQDLFIGSLLLSDAMESAIKSLPEGHKLIFPNKGIQSKPNRLVAIVQTDDIKSLGDKLSVEVENKLLHGARDLISQREEAKKQLKDYFKTYWVSYKLEADYKPSIYQGLEREMGRRKNIRDFKQFPGHRRKCAVNGTYDVLFYRQTEFEKSGSKIGKLFDDAGDVKIINFENPVTFERQLQPGEGLSAISYLKRVYEFDERQSFPSTAEICLLDLMESDIPEVTDFVTSLINLYSKNNIEYQLFFEENHQIRYLEKQGLLVNKNKGTDKFLHQLLTDKHRKMDNAIRKKGWSLERAKYYALLKFDGDKMGTLLSGANLEITESLMDEEYFEKFQQYLSKLLGDFSQWIDGFISGVKGKVVYAGGDDCLAFVNLNHLYVVLHQLQFQFDEQVNKPLGEKYQLKTPFTISAGIAIAHYKEPLSIVVGRANEAEKTAKSISNGDRNAFCFSASSHSGENHEFTYKWNFTDGTLKMSTNQLAADVSYALNQGILSNKFIHNLAMIYERIVDEDGSLKMDLHPGLDLDIIRTINRSTNKAKLDSRKDDGAEGNKVILKRIKERLFKLFSNPDETEKRKHNVKNLLEFLFINEFIARKTNNLQKL